MLRIGVLHEIVDQLDLVILALGDEPRPRRGDIDVLTAERLVGVDVLAHPLLDRGEVLLGQRHAVREVEVVVEAVLDRRPDRDLDARIQLQDRFGEHVGGVVADQIERVLPAAVGDDLKRRRLCAAPVRTRGERPRQVAEFTVDLDREGRPREPGADRRGGVSAGGAVRQ